MAESNLIKGSKVFVWDLPTRLFHWSLVILVVTSVLTGLGWSGLDDEMEIHTWSGIAIIALVFFRLGWGVFGGRHARFTDFVKGPIAVFQYARGLVSGAHERWLGHNPLGGVSVVLMLLLVSAQAALGLFSNDDSHFEGPLFDLVGKDLSDEITHFHHLISNFIFIVVGIHIAAIIFYKFKGERLVGPMVHGFKEAKESIGATGNAKGNIFVALVILAISASLTAWIINL